MFKEESNREEESKREETKKGDSKKSAHLKKNDNRVIQAVKVQESAALNWYWREMKKIGTRTGAEQTDWKRNRCRTNQEPIVLGTQESRTGGAQYPRNQWCSLPQNTVEMQILTMANFDEFVGK